MLASADAVAPEDLEEVAWASHPEIGEVRPKAELMKQARCPGAIGIPATPDPGAVGLSSLLKLSERGRSEGNLMVRLEGCQGLEENKVGGARAVAWRRVRSVHMKRLARDGDCFTKSMICRSGSGVSSLRGHRGHLLQDDAVDGGKRVVVFRAGWRHGKKEPGKQKAEKA